MVDWHTIDTVLLDMDGTLLDLHFDNFFWTEHLPRLYAQKKGLSEQESSAYLHQTFSAQQGRLAWYCVDYWSQELEMDIAMLKRDVQYMITARPFAVEFLSRLHSGRQDVVMVTNAHRKTLEIKMNKVKIRHWFDRVVVSHELHAPKEEQQFWHNLQELHPFDPKRTLLIDDTEQVLMSAQDYGIAHLLTLLQPDSQRAKRATTRFSAIQHFNEIMPEAVSK